MISIRQALNIVVLSLLLYNSDQFQVPSEVLVLYSGTQISLISLLQKVENISTSSLESIKDNVAVVRGANTTIKVFDLDSWGRDRETSSAVSVLIQNVFTKDQCLKNFTIVGPSNSDSAYAVARLIKRSGVSVRHVHTAPLPGPLAAEVRGTSQGLLPPADLLADASVALVKHANWSHIIAIYQDTNTEMIYMFKKLQSGLRVLDEENTHISTANTKCGFKRNKILNYSIVVNEESAFHITRYLEEVLTTHPLRIMFVLANANIVQTLLCKMKDYKYPEYQWVILGASYENLLASAQTSCKHVLEGVLAYAIFIRDNDKALSLTGRYNWMEQLYIRTLLSAINDTEYYEPPIIKIHQFTHTSKDTLQVVSIYNFTEKLFFTNLSLTVIPSEFPVENMLVRPELAIASSIVWVILLCSTIVLHILTVWYRKTKYILATSPKVHQVAFVGTYCLLLAAGIYIFYSVYDLKHLQIHFCNIYWVMLSLGLTVINSVLAVQSWRLYRIFNRYTDPGSMISDKRLMLIVVGLATVNVVLLSLWAVRRPKDYVAPCDIDYNKRIIVTSERCVYEYTVFYILFLSFLFYIFAILAVAVVFSFLIKQTVPKQLEQFRRNHIVSLTYCYGLIIFIGYPIFSVVHMLNDSTFTFICSSCIHFGLVGSPVVLLFASPLSSLFCHQRLHEYIS